ncbi:hypothetical protein CHUAL_005321 [Chamberlinius hualienensis]
MAFLKWATVFLFAAILYYWLTADPTFDASSVRGKHVLITGTSSGIGEQLAYAYSRLGARVVITARRQTLLENVRRKCEQLGAQQVVMVVADMAVASDRERVVAAVREHFGGKLDYLILNHVYAKHGHWISPSNITTLRTAFEINFLSYVEVATLAFDMLTNANGRIGVISSVAGKVPMAGFAFYSASKFALDGFFSTWRQELAMAHSNVSVTNVVLGLIATEAALDSIREGHVNIDPDSAASVEETAQAIIKGVSVRSREMYYPFSACFAVNIHKFIPSLIESISARMTY